MPKQNTQISQENRIMVTPSNFRYEVNLATIYAMDVASKYDIDFGSITWLEVKPGGQNKGIQTITIFHSKVLNDADIGITTVIEEYDVA